MIRKIHTLIYYLNRMYIRMLQTEMFPLLMYQVFYLYLNIEPFHRLQVHIHHLMHHLQHLQQQDTGCSSILGIFRALQQI